MGRVGRWSALLGDINYKMQFISGTENTVADCLSRMIPRDQEKQEKIAQINSLKAHEAVNIITGGDDSEMVALQAADDLCNKIRRYKEKDELDLQDSITMPEWAKHIDLFTEHQGLLYREAADPRRNHGHFQLVVPAAIREKILKVLHSSLLGGHFGFRRTFLKAYRKFWW
jgi:hypothetical protein